jgi:serine/tyrosine/threonine adenylyltransferase
MVRSERVQALLAEDQQAAVETANETLGKFAIRFEATYATGIRHKLGMFQERPDDTALAKDLLDRMARNGADFTLTFRGLCEAVATTAGDTAVRSLFTDPIAYDDWTMRWRRRLADDGEATREQRSAAMRAVNPAFIPRNHLVEEALSAAVDNGDLSAFESLLTVLSRPFDDQPALGRYALPPRPDQVVHQTFCGT